MNSEKLASALGKAAQIVVSLGQVMGLMGQSRKEDQPRVQVRMVPVVWLSSF
jgi:hypothetical protein